MKGSKKTGFRRRFQLSDSLLTLFEYISIQLGMIIGIIYLIYIIKIYY